MRTKGMFQNRLFLIGLLALVAVNLVSCGESGTLAQPGQASLAVSAQESFEAWAQEQGTPYRNARYEALEDDGTFATVEIVAEFRPSAEDPWREEEGQVKCRKVGSSWQCDEPTGFSLEPISVLVSQGNQYYEQGARQWDAGNLQGATNSFRQAAYYYEQALAKDPANAEVRTDLGTMYFFLGRLQSDTSLVDKAIATWNVALQYAPGKPEALFNLGLGYAELGQVDQAVAVWQRVLQVAPDTDIAQSAQQLIAAYTAAPTPTP